MVSLSQSQSIFALLKFKIFAVCLDGRYTCGVLSRQTKQATFLPSGGAVHHSTAMRGCRVVLVVFLKQQRQCGNCITHQIIFMSWSRIINLKLNATGRVYRADGYNENIKKKYFLILINIILSLNFPSCIFLY